MDFRWIAGLALWTVFSGPVLMGLGTNWKSKQPASAARPTETLAAVAQREHR
jgi:hypothetical protein